MADSDAQGVPTYHSNIVTSNLTTDDLTIELRRVDLPHERFLKAQVPGQPLTMIPPPTPADIMALPPVARVVLTYSAARALKQYLDVALPRAEEARRAGTNIT